MDISRTAIKTLKNDGLIVMAADTLYGILGRAHPKKAVQKIYSLKGRDSDKPFIILISKLSDLRAFGIALSDTQELFLKNVWPGKVSVILPCPGKKFSYLHRGTESLAFRLIGPRYRTLHSILKATGPLVAPSANPQGLPPAETAAEAKRYFGTAIDAYLAGPRRRGKPSRIVSLLGPEARIIR